MVRKLPWQVGGDSKTSNKRPSSDASPPALPFKRNKRDASPSSDLDLVDADLNPIIPSTPKRHRALQNPNKSPSTSPPPAPPSVSYMREGFTADDQWMMVEDEFLATAKLYTQQLHHAAYAEAKRRAAARGQDTLRGLQRAGDGRTDQSFHTKIKREAKRNRVKTAGEEEESDAEQEGEWMDPQLAVLMNSRQETVMLGKEGRRLGKAKSETRAAKGFLRSPERARRTRDVYLRQSTAMNTGNGYHEELDQSDDSGDSDDLDGPIRKTTASKLAEPTTSKLEPKETTVSKAPKPTETCRKSSAVFKQFAGASSSSRVARKPFKPSTSDASERNDWKPQVLEKTAPKTSNAFAPGEFGMFGKSALNNSAAEYLAKRKAAKEKRAQDEKRGASNGTRKSSAKAKEPDYADVPTFLI